MWSSSMRRLSDDVVVVDGHTGVGNGIAVPVKLTDGANGHDGIANPSELAYGLSVS